ncbi:hypothetical protein RUM44_001898 [Polyplax serrata]|uniref:Uncharacterized protein n=1 Tax=Polyplax serrata TaxID=468196 RepID=A0ABR1ALC1_POLSC
MVPASAIWSVLRAVEFFRNKSRGYRYGVVKCRHTFSELSGTLFSVLWGVMLHACCTGKQPEKRKRARCLCELSKNQRRNFRRRMKLMGQPKKPIVPDKGPDRGPKKRIKDFEPWLTMISQPRPNPMAEKTNTQNGNAPPPAPAKPKTPKAKKK